MNGTIRNQCRIIEQSIALLMRELETDRAGAYRYAYTRVGTHVQARTQARTITRVRDLYPNSNLTIKQIDITEGAQGPSSKASINQFLNLDFVLGVAKKYMNEIPDWYVKWWHATQTANGWTTNQGKSITDKSWRPLLMTWWRNADEKERSRIENEAKAEKSAAEAKKVYSAADWAVCGQAGCLYYNDEKCLCSLLVGVPPKVPRKCTKFAKVRD